LATIPVMPTDNKNALQKAIAELGPYRAARICGVRGPSVYKWLANRRLPRTEWTGETHYAEAIVAALAGKYSRDDLLTFKSEIEERVPDEPEAIA
jgi:hypothetical protein